MMFFTSMQLTVGPAALVSLLTGQLITKYGIPPNTQEAVDFAGECAVAVGLILLLLSVFRLGDLIRYISFPVISGFTTAAAMLIGQNQIKSAFGFLLKPPRTGQKGYENNYLTMRWFIDHRNSEAHAKKPFTGYFPGKNKYAIRICFGLYFAMMFFVVLKAYIKPTAERKKTWLFSAWTIVVNLLPFVAIIIGAHVAYELRDSQHGKPTKDWDYYIWQLFNWPFDKLLAGVFPTA